MRHALRWAIAVPAAAGLGLLCVFVAQEGRSDAIAYNASVEMGTWSASHAQPGEQTWSWVRDDLNLAAKLDPKDPVVQDLLGALHASRHDRPEYISQAVVYFRNALEMRPTSPYTWANLAEAKYRLGDTGKEFEVALVRAAELGPSEPEVQRIVADFGLAVWDEAKPETRLVIDRMVAAGLRRNPPEMLQISGRRGRLQIACRHAASVPGSSQSKWSQLCLSTEAI
ncbi:MAG: hypothetical protein ACXWF6_16920 [Usitatibacter sp.]